VPPADPAPAAPIPARSRWQRLLDYRLLLGLATGVFVLDQLTKAWINHHLPFPTYGPPVGITVIEGFFYLIHVGNTGAAWSLFTGQSTWLALLAFVTLGAIYWWRRALGLRERITQLAFGLMCGGILGNFVDRLVHGHVIDFLDFHFGSYVYPTFNIADSGIVVGVGIYLIHSLRQPAPAEDAPKQP
jgi:signal peptidase II